MKMPAMKMIVAPLAAAVFVFVSVGSMAQQTQGPGQPTKQRATDTTPQSMTKPKVAQPIDKSRAAIKKKMCRDKCKKMMEGSAGGGPAPFGGLNTNIWNACLQGCGGQ